MDLIPTGLSLGLPPRVENEDGLLAGQQIPPGLEDSGLGMSNFDHSIDAGLEVALRAGQRGEHTAWDFYGEVWFDGTTDEFCEDVLQYRSYVATVRARSLPELMEAVNAEYGYD